MNEVQFGKVKARGLGECEGGYCPPGLAQFPLLVWTDGMVKLEDGKATVDEVVLAIKDVGDIGLIAQQFGTSYEHVNQAIRYAESLS